MTQVIVGTIGNLANDFLVAKSEYDDAWEAFNAADIQLMAKENLLMNKMQLIGIDQITIGDTTYKIVGVRLQAFPSEMVYPTPSPA